MERKIGEIFEYNGEWYQCVESQDGSCKHCDMNFEGKCPIPIKECTESGRSDKSYVIFKKLEKVGEPYSDYCPSGRIICFQRYKCYQKPIYTGNFICWADDINISIEIKQTKEDIEENKLNLKPFDIQKAREGNPVCTRDGRKARIICFDKKGDFPIVALVNDYNEEEYIKNYDKFGKNSLFGETTDDLMMLPEKKEGWVNVYKGGLLDTKSYPTKKEAFDKACPEGYIDTIKISWEE